MQLQRSENLVGQLQLKFKQIWLQMLEKTWQDKCTGHWEISSTLMEVLYCIIYCIIYLVTFSSNVWLLYRKNCPFSRAKSQTEGGSEQQGQFGSSSQSMTPVEDAAASIISFSHIIAHVCVIIASPPQPCE